jgi:hypothetical protein
MFSFFNSLTSNKPKVVLVGLVRNCEFSFAKEYSKLLAACTSLEIVDSFFVESDSSDKSVAVLQSMSDENQNLHFVTLGELESAIPHRIERIRFCRNLYVKYIRELNVRSSFEYVIVADMDGINSALSKHAIDSCFANEDWDAQFSNQLFGASDLLALRAKNWLEEDYLIELERSRVHLRNASEAVNLLGKIRQYIRYDKTRKKIIYDRMRFLGFGKKLIPVNSAFGGIGLYRSWCFLEADYLDAEIPHECEHVTFHRKLKSFGARMYINPRFINSIINTYNINKFFLIRNIRIWRWNRIKSRG